MANISLKRLFEAEDFKAKSKETGKLVHFKSKDAYQAALKAGTHEDPKAQKVGTSKGAAKSNDMFGGDYSKDRGGETPTANTSHTPVKPDSKEVNIISGFTRMREKFVADFINKHKLDADALSKFVHKGSLRDRMDVGTAMAGNPGNEYEKELIKKFGAKEVTSTSPSNMGVDKIVYNKRTNTVGIVRMADERGETKTDADGNVNTSELEPYNPIKYPHQNGAKVAPSTQKEVDARGLWNPFAQTEESTKLTSMLPEAEDFKARSKETGKLVHFKSKDSYDAAIKAGSHEDPKAQKVGTSKGAAKSNDMFGGDYSKDRGGEAPTANTSTKSKYDDKSYWKDDKKRDTTGALDYDMSDYDDNDFWGEGPQLTANRLSKVEDALEDELNLRGNGFETTRESGGGGGGFEGPMTIVSKDADYDDEDNFISLSVGSPNNDGKFSIVFANANGEPHFEPDYDALTGDKDLTPHQAYKVTKALMQMPEVQKVLKGEMKMDEFKPIYDKLKSKFSKTKAKKESTKLTSMFKK